MENLIFSINVVLPMALIGVLGFFLKRIGLITKEFLDVTFKLVFGLVLPCSMLGSITSAPPTEAFDFRLVLFTVGALTAIFALSTLLIPRLIRDPAIAASMAHGAFRSNFILLGVPLATRLFGDAGMAPAMLIIPFVVFFNNVFSALIFIIIIPDSQGNSKSVLINSMRRLAFNPLIISSVLCLLIAIFSLPVPSALQSAVDSIGKMATPLGLIALGAQFDPQKLKGNLRYSMSASFSRLAVSPIAVMPFAVAMGFRGPELGALFVLFAAPSAFTSYIMSRSMGGNDEVAGQIVCFTTLFSAFTMVLGIFALKSLALI